MKTMGNKEIALITINDNKNIGNRLQNYAMYKVLSEYGSVTNLVRFIGCEILSYKDIKKSRKIGLFKNMIKLLLLGKHRYSAKRYFAFNRFNRLINNGHIISMDTNYVALNSQFDYFVAGSDQVWNPDFEGNGMYINMLGFASPNKRIAGCPSISIDSLTDEQEEEFKKYLSDYNYLSCREKSGSEIISRLTNKNCVTLLDPTFLLSEREWNKVSKKPRYKIPSRYVLLFFLGGISAHYKKIIEEIQKQINIPIINISDYNSKYYGIGPSEFIFLVKNSFLVLTDSFHGSVFSLIFRKPLRIFKRISKLKSMNSRLDNLVSTFQLDKRIIIDDFTTIESINMDFSDVFLDDKILLEEQKRFRTYLDYSFDELR